MIRLAWSPSRREEVVALEPDMGTTLERWQARPGDVLTMVDPAGRYFRARLLPRCMEAVVFESLPAEMEPRHPRRLCPVIPERERMLLILQKAVELGVTEIYPLLSERGQPVDETRHGQNKSSTWNRIILKAARQCRRAIIPRLHPVQPLDRFMAGNSDEKRAFLDAYEPRVPLPVWHQHHRDQPMALLCGPEGGWSDRERQLMSDHHITAVSLGHRILRTETAAIAALAVVATLDSTFT
ncbi:MAG: RNA methyltransferase [Magnetococcales bacterium]|nr:RNA methyltransferase [Magnetococcales bacterium]